MSLQTTRREALKAGAALVVSLAVPLHAATETRKRWAMYIDVSKCYGCYACVAACAAENNVPIGVFRTWVERHVTKGGTVIFVPKQCNHCENAPCVKPCPTGATYKTKDGLVLVNDDLCIGCGACIQACPYRARFFSAPFRLQPDAGGSRAGGVVDSPDRGSGRVGRQAPSSSTWRVGGWAGRSGPGPGGR